jgi:RNA polymerase sigma-70 factor (ECF subfamily)
MLWADPPLEAPAAAGPEERTFPRFYAEYFEIVYRLISRYGVRASEIEDLAQRVFMVVHARRAELGVLEKPEAWLRSITIRVVRHYYRWQRVRRAHAWLVRHSWAGRGIDERTPEQAALGDESLERLRTVLGQLSPKLRDTLVLVDLEELLPREAADILGVPLNTVRSRRALARAEFRRLWQGFDQQRTRDHA